MKGLFYFFLSVIFLYSFSIKFLLKNLFKVQLLMGQFRQYNIPLCLSEPRCGMVARNCPFFLL
jgi:hypothetical protein